ncbi:G2E3 ligase, partial [Turnix velox]|nr:G2E3 ligase [Turnix velox]
QKCCICRLPGASVTCQGHRCHRTFHFPCGIERGCISQFFWDFKSFCWKHRPVQRVKVAIKDQLPCVICLEMLVPKPSYDILVCLICTNAWFHRHCIQRYALFSALYHFYCPLCRDVDLFRAEMFRLGIKIPDR